MGVNDDLKLIKNQEHESAVKSKGILADENPKGEPEPAPAIPGRGGFVFLKRKPWVETKEY
jgi:hypothetical protein